MSRLLAIDYGLKRTGLAWTDPLRIIATGLGTVETPRLLEKIGELVRTEKISAFILGMPSLHTGEETHTTRPILAFREKLQKQFPGIPVILWDESHTSARAMQEMIKGGVKRSRRSDKQLVNEVAATLILQDYLNANPS